MARRWLVQFIGVFLLAVVVFGFLNTPDQRAWQVAASIVLALIAVGGAAWLVRENFGGRWFAPILGCVLLLLVLLWGIGLIGYPVRWKAATWLGSALTMKRKKPITPEFIEQALEWILFFVRWMVLPLLLIPLTVRAAGGKPVGFPRLAVTWIGLFLLGAVLPHAIAHMVPHLPEFWPQVFSAAGRFFVAYLMMITAWVALGRLTRAEFRS